MAGQFCGRDSSWVSLTMILPCCRPLSSRKLLRGAACSLDHRRPHWLFKTCLSFSKKEIRAAGTFRTLVARDVNLSKDSSGEPEVRRALRRRRPDAVAPAPKFSRFCSDILLLPCIIHAPREANTKDSGVATATIHMDATRQAAVFKSNPIPAGYIPQRYPILVFTPLTPAQ